MPDSRAPSVGCIIPAVATGTATSAAVATITAAHLFERISTPFDARNQMV
jgi:hypothetical protein